MGTELVTTSDSSNVGIGTSTPQSKLHVVGDLKVEGKINGTRVYSGHYYNQYFWGTYIDNNGIVKSIIGCQTLNFPNGGWCRFVQYKTSASYAPKSDSACNVTVSD